MTEGASEGRPAGALPRLVWVLGAVSFCTDLASELIVPLLPALMLSLGGGMLQLGALQGLSDLAVAGLKIASGRLSDRQRRRRPWLLFGYGLSALTRPLFAFVGTPLAAIAVRFTDRVGKGLRSAPRDALLTAAVAREQRGHAFGVQRALDHAGALAGALTASSLLWLGVAMRDVFLLALVPGLAAIGLIALWVRDVEAPAAIASPAASQGPRRRLGAVLAVVACSAASSAVDLFALAQAQRQGVPLAALPLLWVVLHSVRSALAAPLGRLSDRRGRRGVLHAGLLAQAVVLFAFAGAEATFWFWPLFALLGLHAACTEGAERALVADYAGGRLHGTAFGLFHAVQGLAACFGALLLGALQDGYGAGAGFVAGGLIALAGSVVLTRLPPAP